MAEIRCEVCGREYQTKSGLRRHVKAEHAEETLTPTPSVRPLRLGSGQASVRTFGATQDYSGQASSLKGEGESGQAEGTMPGPRLPKPASGGGQVLDRALSVLKIERDDVMSYRIGNDRVVVIQGPVGYKRTYVFPGAQEVEG